MIENVDELNEMIWKVAGRVASDFPDVEEEDLAQDLWEMMLKERSTHDKTHEGWFHSFLTKRARKIAWDRRKEHLQWTSQYSYRNSDVRKILEHVFDKERWESMPIPADAKSEDRNRLDVAVDISWAFDKLSVGYQAIIKRKYVDHETFTTGAEKSRFNKAVARLTDILNFYRGKVAESRQGPGHRKVISNAHAGYIIQEQYDD